MTAETGVTTCASVAKTATEVPYKCDKREQSRENRPRIITASCAFTRADLSRRSHAQNTYYARTHIIVLFLSFSLTYGASLVPSVPLPFVSIRPSVILSLARSLTHSHTYTYTSLSLSLTLSTGNIPSSLRSDSSLACETTPPSGRQHGRGRALSRTAGFQAVFCIVYLPLGELYDVAARARAQGRPYFHERNSHGVILARRTAPL